MSEPTVNTERVEVNLHLYPHATYSDAMSFEQHAMEADIMAPEMHLGSKGGKQLQRLASGEEKMYSKIEALIDPGDRQFARGILDIIQQRSHMPKPFSAPLLDVPLSAEWREKMDTIRFLEGSLITKPTLSDTLEVTLQGLKINTGLQNEREGIIADNVMRYLASYPTTRDPDEDKTVMLIPIGSLHFDLKKKLVDRGLAVTISQNSDIVTPQYGPYHARAWRVVKQGEIPSEELLMKSLICSLIADQDTRGRDLIHCEDSIVKSAAEVRITDIAATLGLEALCQEVIKLSKRKGLGGLYDAADQIMLSVTGQARLEGQAAVEHFLMATSTPNSATSQKSIRN